MTATTRGSPVGGNESQGQAPDAQSQPPLPQNQVRISTLIKSICIIIFAPAFILSNMTANNNYFNI